MEKMQITDDSIDTAGLSKDYRVCLSEYIWNAFDAGASIVEIKSIDSNYLDVPILEEIQIIDNGQGINYEELNLTFGTFLSSNKKKNPSWSNIHGSKGKGRLSFLSFANNAEWNTVYKENDKSYRYSIFIDKNYKAHFKKTNKQEVDDNIGTKVIISNINDITTDNINSKEFREVLLNKFAWFLYLNRANDYKILVNGKSLDYNEIIDEEVSCTLNEEIESDKFEINFIKWRKKIDEKYFNYFLDNNMEEKYKKHTSFNNSSIEFPHSVFIKSSYFNEFIPVEDNTGVGQLNFKKNQKDIIFIKLIEKLKEIIEERRKMSLRRDKIEIISKFNEQGIMPEFKQNKYDQERKRDLENVVSEIYFIEPKIFSKGSIEQKKSIVGFLNLLLDSDEREGIINIIDNITSMTSEERSQLNSILKKTSFTRIMRVIKMIEDRYKVIEILKKLVYDMSKFTTERNHIQKIIEENYWIFGEEYNLVTADKNFEEVLKGYTYMLDGKDNSCIDSPEKFRRPDIFICRSRFYEMPNSIDSEENIIIELKRPNVTLNKQIYRQVEDYMELIMSENKFNSNLRKWKFILVSTSVDDHIKELYKSYQDKGRAFLVRWVERYEIYAMTWDDVFKSFDIRHRYLYKKLNYDKSIIEEELKSKGIDISRHGADKLTEEALLADAK